MTPGAALPSNRLPGRPLRVLFVESARGTIGGSGHSLLHIVRHVDRDRIEPSVLLFEHGFLEEQLVASRCQLIVWQDVRTLNEDSQAHAAAGAVGHALFAGARSLLGGVLRMVAEDLPHALRLEALIRDLGADLVHANDRVRSNAFAIYGAWLAGRPVVVSERLFYPYRWTDRFASRRVSLMIAVSHAIRDSVRAQGGAPARLEVLHNPVGLPEVDESRAHSADGRITFIGRLVPWKGAHIFIRACALVAQRHPAARFFVVGGASPGSEEYAENLRRLASDQGCDGKLTFTGPVSDVDSVLRRSAIVVHASTTPEPFGRVLIEAMAYGIPVVATRMGGPLEILEEGETGLFADPDSPEDLARAMSWLLDHPDRAQAMGAQGRRHARERFDPRRYARILESWYAALVPSPGTVR